MTVAVIVTKLRRESHGELEANISVDGDTVSVTRQYGSWRIRRDGGGFREILAVYAALLEERARPFERAEQKERAEPKDPPTFSEPESANLRPVQNRKEG